MKLDTLRKYVSTKTSNHTSLKTCFCQLVQASLTHRGWFTPPLAAEPQKIDRYPGANKHESFNFVTNQGFI